MLFKAVGNGHCSHCLREGRFEPVKKLSNFIENTSYDELAYRDDSRELMKLRFGIIVIWLLAIAAAVLFFSLGCTLFSSACY